MTDAELAAALTAFAARRPVLVALDFDGVLAPIVADRDGARALPGTLDAVEALAGRPDTHVVLVSGRALGDLRAVSGVAPETPVSFVGSHGAEELLRGVMDAETSSGHDTVAMTSEEQDRLERVIEALREIAHTDPALDVELKPTGAVLHTRAADADVAHDAEQRALAGPGSWPGVHAIHGKAVVELAVVETSKGVAVQRLRATWGVAAVLYVGDDVTDETAFAVLGPDDVGVKVGPGDTVASYRVEGPADVRDLLQRLVAERSQR